MKIKTKERLIGYCVIGITLMGISLIWVPVIIDNDITARLIRIEAKQDSLRTEYLAVARGVNSIFDYLKVGGDTTLYNPVVAWDTGYCRWHILNSPPIDTSFYVPRAIDYYKSKGIKPLITWFKEDLLIRMLRIEIEKDDEQ